MKFDDVKKLSQKKYREETGYFLVEGEHLVEELRRAAERDARWRASELYVTEKHEAWSRSFTTHVIGEAQMAQLSETDTPQGIVALVPMPAPIAPTLRERVVYLHEVQDPGNLGTILRTLAWFGQFRCLLSPNSVDPFNGKAVRSSMGAIFHVPIEREVALSSLRQRYARIACLTMAGAAPATPEFRSFECYVFGNEARGLPQDAVEILGAEAFCIPGCGALESLNLASAVNVCAYELSR